MSPLTLLPKETLFSPWSEASQPAFPGTRSPEPSWITTTAWRGQLAATGVVRKPGPPGRLGGPPALLQPGGGLGAWLGPHLCGQYKDLVGTYCFEMKRSLALLNLALMAFALE
jgi:hypothetical protein